jgi:drug/metabolite transporter (DMT)-like permease
LFAFFLQIKAQKVLSPSLSSIIFLLESPFASLFAFLLLGDRMTPLQALGGVMIFVAAFTATQLGSARSNRKGDAVSSSSREALE